MTEELLAQALKIQKNIHDINCVLDSIEKIEINGGRRTYKPHLKLFNMLKKKNGKEVREATVLLFDGVSIYGTEIPVDESFLDCLKEYYQSRLTETKAELDSL